MELKLTSINICCTRILYFHIQASRLFFAFHQTFRNIGVALNAKYAVGLLSKINILKLYRTNIVYITILYNKNMNYVSKFILKYY